MKHYIYLLADLGDGRLFIGTTDGYPDSQLRAREVAAGRPLVYLGYLSTYGHDSASRAELMHAFAEHHIMGGWFRDVPAIRERFGVEPAPSNPFTK